MKIAQVVCVVPPITGGIGRSADQFSQVLGHRAEITTFSPATIKPWLKYGYGAVLLPLLWRLRGFDYIYLHYPFFGTAEVIWLFKLFAPRPRLIIHYHMDTPRLSGPAQILSLPSRLIRSSLFKQAEFIVTASLDYVKSSQIKKYYAKYPDRFREIPFGLDLEKFQPQILQRPAAGLQAKAQEIIKYVTEKFIKKNRLNLLFVGGLDQAHYFKGLDILLTALDGLNPALWRLKIIGDGDRRVAYESLVKEKNLDRQIEFAGQVSDAELIKSYQNSDLLILPSINRHEAFGFVLIEALACGLPVIASDLPGVRSVFNNYQEGLLVEPGSADDLQKKLTFIFDREDLRQQLALNARRLAETRYDWRLMQRRLEELFF